MTAKWTAGRYIRTVLGSVTLLVAVYLVFLEVRAIVSIPTFKVEWEHVVLHGLLLVTSWALIDKTSLLEVLAALPFVGRMGRAFRRTP